MNSNTLLDDGFYVTCLIVRSNAGNAIMVLNLEFRRKKEGEILTCKVFEPTQKEDPFSRSFMCSWLDFSIVMENLNKKSVLTLTTKCDHASDNSHDKTIPERLMLDFENGTVYFGMEAAGMLIPKTGFTEINIGYFQHLMKLE